MTLHKPTSRAFRQLANLPDAELFSELAEGLSKIHEHVLKLQAELLAAGEAKLLRLVRIGSVFLREEAAKYLILLDAVRCPRAGLALHLGKASLHPARAIYADVCEWHVVNFGELRGYIESDLSKFYLDGPNDVGWVLPNSLNAEREQALYVDYYCTDDGGHFWHSPLGLDETICGWAHVPNVATLVKALHAVGLGSPEALAHVATMWREVDVHDEMANGELYRCILAARTSETLHVVLNRWHFPLHSVDLTLRNVPLHDLQRERRSGWVEA
jgi:hypothetical protein